MGKDIEITSGSKRLQVNRIDCAEIDEEDYYELIVNTRDCNDAQRFVFESSAQARKFISELTALIEESEK